MHMGVQSLSCSGFQDLVLQHECLRNQASQQSVSSAMPGAKD